jgi:hypothetical protein
MLANARQSIADWIFRAKTPEAPPVTLVQRRIFVLPTKQGYLFALVSILLLASINYALSLGFITFLLGRWVRSGCCTPGNAHLKLRPGCPVPPRQRSAEAGVPFARALAVASGGATSTRCSPTCARAN